MLSYSRGISFPGHLRTLVDLETAAYVFDPDPFRRKPAELGRVHFREGEDTQMKKLWLSMVVSLLTGAWAGNVHADLIFDNLANTPTFEASAAGVTWLAQKFKTDGQAYTLNSITLWMREDTTIPGAVACFRFFPTVRQYPDLP